MSVYLDYYGLKQPPFAITPDPGYVYLSQRHQDALAHLLYGIGHGGSGGFVQLTGEVGTGKTTLCRCLLEQVPENTTIALILNPVLSPHDLLQAICEELRITYADTDTSRQLVNHLNHYLLAAHARGERVVLVVDEAQCMQPEALEQVRLLTNLETHTDKLLQIILLGQPELRQLLSRQELRQLAQRITARYHLEPLDIEETAAYVRHRLQVAGRSQPLFNRSGYQALYQLSGGVPRLINIYADRALMGGYASDAEKIDANLVKMASREVSHTSRENGAGPTRWSWVLTTVVAVSVVLALLWPDVLKETAHGDSLSDSGVPDNDNTLSAADTADSADIAPAIDNQGLVSLGRFRSTPDFQAEPITTLADSDAVSDWLQQGIHNALWQKLAVLWQVDAVEFSNACQSRSIENVVFCVTLSGSWGRLRQLDIPVILQLSVTAPEQLAPVLLTGLNDQYALLHNGEDESIVSLDQLRERWDGSYTAICPGHDRAWQPGAEDGDIQQLKQHAAQILSQPYRGSISSHYDGAFADWVEGFQRRNGLLPDRIIGVETRLFLCAARVDVPRLQNLVIN